MSDLVSPGAELFSVPMPHTGPRLRQGRLPNKAQKGLLGPFGV